MFYHFYEMSHAAMAPLRALADSTMQFYSNPTNPMSDTLLGRQMAATAEVFERSTRRYGKPEFGITQTTVNGVPAPVHEKIIWSKPFCKLLHFDRALPEKTAKGPKLLIVAPMSGHYATLLRGTVNTMTQYADVYITDWTDARLVPLSEGKFSLSDYIDYVIEMVHLLGKETHVMAVCQPSVPVLAAVAYMETNDDPLSPASMILMGGPIDTRENPTAVNKMAEGRTIKWFRDNVIMQVPFPHPGFLRSVYPGFLQLSGFMSMNLDRHVTAQQDFFNHLVMEDGDSAEKHREFYDEYLAVMDLDSEFYLETVDHVFIKHSLPTGELMHHGKNIDCAKITRTALLTVEGENDDITGLGHTQAAHNLCTGLAEEKKQHYLQPKVGHYGVFNGSRFRAEIAPRIVDFMDKHDTKKPVIRLVEKFA